MYDTCGKKGGIFGQALPCADNGKARQVRSDMARRRWSSCHDQVDDTFRAQLVDMCGEAAWKEACCTPDQLDTLQQSLAQAEPLLALCPACRLNFRDFYCAFTCSPDQSTFVTVTAAQNLSAETGPAVKTVAFHVDPTFGKGFFESCQNVKFGATNGYAMDLIGGGAKDWLSFLTFMGTEVRLSSPLADQVRRPDDTQRPGLGSPFGIAFPQPADHLPDSPDPIDGIAPLAHTPLSCSSSDPAVRCACLDCPDVCLELPYRPSPDEIEACALRDALPRILLT
jgi:Niemann-Pick C1 protein